MKSEQADLAQIAESLGALRAEVARLGERLALVEANAKEVSATAAPIALVSTPPPAANTDTLDEEIVLAIGAALAAYLGVKPHIRQIQLLGGASWAQQGRMTIQASHALSNRHG